MFSTLLSSPSTSRGGHECEIQKNNASPLHWSIIHIRIALSLHHSHQDCSFLVVSDIKKITAPLEESNCPRFTGRGAETSLPEGQPAREGAQIQHPALCFSGAIKPCAVTTLSQQDVKAAASFSSPTPPKRTVVFLNTPDKVFL